MRFGSLEQTSIKSFSVKRPCPLAGTSEIMSVPHFWRCLRRHDKCEPGDKEQPSRLAISHSEGVQNRAKRRSKNCARSYTQNRAKTYANIAPQIAPQYATNILQPNIAPTDAEALYPGRKSTQRICRLWTGKALHKWHLWGALLLEAYMNTIASDTHSAQGAINTPVTADPKERQIQRLNYDTFINVMAEMMQKYASKVLEQRR